MNAHGAPPVIVLSPQHPQVTAAVGPLGWNARRRQLHRLSATRCRAATTSCCSTSPTSPPSAATPDDFYDGYHLTVPNTRRLIDAVLTKAGDALRRQ